MPDVTPDPKPTRAPRKPYRRKVASRKQWEAIIAAKGEPCRLCIDKQGNGRFKTRDPLVEFHHIVARVHGGDDIEDNIVALCRECHDEVTRRVKFTCGVLMRRLTDAEYAYMIERGGEDYPVRAYGIEYRR